MLKYITHAGALALGLAIGFFLLREGKPSVSPTITVTLAPDEDTKIVHTPDTITVAKRKPDGSTVVSTQPNYGHGTTTTRKTDGNTVVTVKEKGFTFDFGLSTDFRSIGVAEEFFYYRRLSVLGGSHFINLKTGKPQLNLFIGIGYRLPMRKLNNLSVYGGYDTDQRIIGGVFHRFGNS